MNYWNMNIKQVIDNYPNVGKLLIAYGIDCATCAIATCLLKDVMSIHNLSYETEQLVKEQIEQIINREEIDLSTIKPIKSEVKKVEFCPSIKELVNEHKNILRILELAEYLVNKKSINENDKETLNQVFYYVKNYADKYHHAKEEDILFKMTDENQEIIKVMYKEHDYGRKYIANAVEALSNNNIEIIRENITNYIELLRNHIKKEDNILYVWFENKLTNNQKEQLAIDCKKANQSLDNNLEKELLDFLYSKYV